MKELKLALHECRGQLRCAEKLNSEYEEKVNNLSVIQLLIAIYVFRYKDGQPTTPSGQFVTSPNLVNLLSVNSMYAEYFTLFHDRPPSIQETARSLDF